MPFYDSIKTYASGISLFAMSVLSIGISAWQFQNNANGVDYPGGWDDFCNSYPVDILRPISVKITGYDKPSYCGYSTGNTGYRLAVAIVTLLFSIVPFIRILDDRPGIFHACFWALYSLWFLAIGLDIMAIANGQASCKDIVTGGTGDCNNAVYGVTVAIDVAVIVVISVFLYFQVQSLKAGGGSAGNAF